MGAKLTVFVCGTFNDLSEERQEVLESIRKLQFQHDSMEYFGARPNKPLETCFDEVRSSDVLVVLVGHTYGSVIPELGISYTEAEYGEGYRLGKPCLVYIRDENVPILPKFMEDDPDKIKLLKRFKRTLGLRHTTAKFKNAHELALSVAADLSRIIQNPDLIQDSIGDHFEILKRGIEEWNNWRIRKAPRFLNLDGIDLSHANLKGGNFGSVSLRKANLTGADLREANLVGADLRGANLRQAILLEADLRDALLDDADLGEVQIGKTKLENIDFSKVMGLEEIIHNTDSILDTKTLHLSNGRIPAKFLRGCGLSEVETEFAKMYNPDLTNEEIVKIQYRMFDLRATVTLQISPLFISYSHADSAFVDQLDYAFTDNGVRFWRDIHDAKAGRLAAQIDLAIRQNPTVLLVLSQNSIKSDWVEHEVRKARELEKELGRDALCPVALDDSWKSSPWPERVMEQIMEYNILDFSRWQDSSAFESKFAKLLSGLDLFYKKPES